MEEEETGYVIPKELADILIQAHKEGRLISYETTISFSKEFWEQSGLAFEISSAIGDTFIDFKEIPPVNQWYTIIKLLNEHGYEILKKEN